MEHIEHRSMDLTETFFKYFWVVGILGLLSALYRYLTKHHGYWASFGIPYVKPYPIIGSFSAFFLKPFHLVELERYKKYGKIYGAYEGMTCLLSVADPELLKYIFVKDFHVFPERRNIRTGHPIDDKVMFGMRKEDWKDVRSIVTPSFTSGKLRKISTIFTECAEMLTANLLEISKEGKVVNCKSMFGAFVMDVICSSAFGLKIDSYRDSQNRFVTSAHKTFNTNFNWRFGMAFLFPSIRRLFKVRVFDANGLEFYESVVHQLVDERRNSGQKRQDFFQLLLDSANQNDIQLDDVDKEFSKIGYEEGNAKVLSTGLKKRGLTIEELIAQCFTFFIAGYNTTASILSCAVYSLARNPEYQERLIKEVDEIFAKYGKFDYDIIKEMKYLDCVISETLRLYSPGVRAERRADRDYTLGDTGIVIRKGMIVTIPIYAIHHDPDNYPDPEKFDPSRFSPENQSTRKPYTFLPFGAGPRNCIGMRFAMMEMKMCLAHVYRHLRFKVCPETSIPLKFFIGQPLLHPKELKLAAEPRADIPRGR